MRGRSKSKAGPKWGGTNNDSGFEDFGLVRIYSGFQGLGGGGGGVLRSIALLVQPVHVAFASYISKLDRSLKGTLSPSTLDPK